jgi:3-hydroxyisobutyrate dehydrogenase-like beta-hydroxyacid dehydrogenase
MGGAMALRFLGAGMPVDVWSRRAASTTSVVADGADST